MYIPIEVIYYLLGFISFPIFAYGVYEFILKKREKNEIDSKKDPDGELDKSNKDNTHQKKGNKIQANKKVLWEKRVWGWRIGGIMSKFFSKKVEVDGIKFDSKKEGQVYLELKDKEKKGEIKDLILQKEFILQDNFKIGNKTRRKITYKADFVYVSTEDDKLHVVDVKSPYTAKDKVYRIKKKLFEKKYNMELEEII